MIFQWLEKRRQVKELFQQRLLWNAYCSNWWVVYYAKYIVAFAKVKSILDEDIQETRHWTA